MGWWRIPRAEIPVDRDERVEWLFEWWRRIDVWVDEHRPVDLPRPTNRRWNRKPRPQPDRRRDRDGAGR